MIWVIGVSAFVGSYYMPLVDNADDQANWFLTIALIPAIILGVYFYGKNSIRTNGLALGSYMFLLTMLLDALITVPLFIIPIGGNHLNFFGDPSFWFLGIEYLLLVAIARKHFERIQRGFQGSPIYNRCSSLIDYFPQQPNLASYWNNYHRHDDCYSI